MKKPLSRCIKRMQNKTHRFSAIKRKFKQTIFVPFILLAALIQPVYAQISGKEIVKKAIDQYRGKTSYSVFTMVIHRPDWERSMTMEVWTQGLDKSLVRVIKPKKDAGNGNLLLGEEMWSFTPKINRVIKIPGSMSQQSWMGSDFSNNDIARADDIIDKYTHRVLEEKKENGHRLYTVESVPHEDAPVVWGKEILTIRDDFVLMDHTFYDQAGEKVKTLTTTSIKKFDGREVAAIQRMQKTDKKDEWTEVRVEETKFDIAIPARVFTLSNLRNPRK
ncbi:MAG: outer membrane lipoprotein-sorting protein [Gammaproteobacteria bacterium]|nr:outer membrane lipoprotein-sorting protein [Gammaproteobacteria bacterium]